MRSAVWRVGVLARRTGVSVRALHHYDAIGLLSPSQRSEAGYRLYDDDDIARLQRIKSLQQVGFALEEIRDLLDSPEVSPQKIVELQLRRLQERIALERELCDRLEGLARRLASAEGTSAEEFIQILEAMNVVDKYYTSEQRARLQERARQVGAERIRQVEAEWPELIAQVRVEMERGTDPGDERVQQLADRWQSLVEEFTGGDPGITASLQTMYANEPSVRQQAGVDPELFAYVGKALAIMRAEK